MSEQEVVQPQEEPKPAKRQNRWLLPACIGGALLLLCACYFLFFGKPMDPKEKAIVAFCNALQSENYEAAYQNFLTDSLRNDVPFEEFKANFSGFTFFNQIGGRKAAENDDVFELRIDGRTDGALTRTLIVAKKFDENNRFDQIMMVEVRNAVYGDKVDDFTAPSGDYILSLTFFSNVDPTTADMTDPNIYIERNGEEVAQVGVTSSMMYDSGPKEYIVYFAVPRDKMGPDLTFAYWGQDIPLKDLLKEVELKEAE